MRVVALRVIANPDPTSVLVQVIVCVPSVRLMAAVLPLSSMLVVLPVIVIAPELERLILLSLVAMRLDMTGVVLSIPNI